LRILVAEDVQVNQKVAVLILSKLGYRADVIANGLEVLHAFHETSYDVVFMDMQMPEMDGMEATRKLRELHPAETAPWTIALTASAMSSDRDTCFKAGMNDFISKPICGLELQAALERFAACRLPSLSEASEKMSGALRGRSGFEATATRIEWTALQSGLEASPVQAASSGTRSYQRPGTCRDTPSSHARLTRR